MHYYPKNSIIEYNIAFKHKDHAITQTLLFTAQAGLNLEQIVAKGVRESSQYMKDPKDNYVLIGVKPTIPLLELLEEY
jgi:hypothetical protein